jgi:hypothetical protein
MRGSAVGGDDQRALMHDYDIENQFELGDLAEDSDGQRSKRTSFEEERMAGRLRGAGRGRVQKESVQPKRNSMLR